MSNKKSIIFCAPSDYGISYSIKCALEDMGFTVFYFPVADSPYLYKSIKERLYNSYRKVFLKDYQYKNKLKMKQRYEELNISLQNTPLTESALVIRPDLFPEEFIKTVKSKSKITAGYQWDGLDRFPTVFNYIDFFDRFFVFDSNDINKHPNILPLTNFYIPTDIQVETLSKEAYFLGSYDRYRFNIIKNLKNSLENMGYETKFLFVTNDKKEKELLKKSKFEIQKALDYKENINNVELSSLIVDIHVPIHSGLSFRTFEALSYGKKLITTNESIKHYDFYHPNNIFIWDTSNEEELLNFLELEYCEVPEQIKKKYAFTNWISYLLDNGDYTSIQLPSKS